MFSYSCVLFLGHGVHDLAFLHSLELKLSICSSWFQPQAQLAYLLFRQILSTTPLQNHRHNFICSVTPHRNGSALWSTPPTSCQIHCHPALTRHPSKRQTYHRTGRADTKTTLKLSPVPPFCNRRSNKTRYAYKRWLKKRLGASVDKQNFSKPAHSVKSRGPRKRRDEGRWEPKAVLLKTNLHLGPEYFTHAALDRFFHNSIIIGHTSSVAPWSLHSTLQTLKSCPHQPDAPNSCPVCFSFFFPALLLPWSSSTSLHMFLPGIFYNTKLTMSCPTTPYLWSYACSLNSSTEQNRKDSLTGLNDLTQLVSHHFLSSAFPEASRMALCPCVFEITIPFPQPGMTFAQSPLLIWTFHIYSPKQPTDHLPWEICSKSPSAKEGQGLFFIASLSLSLTLPHWSWMTICFCL